jgi:hypothetical protein
MQVRIIEWLGVEAMRSPITMPTNACSAAANNRPLWNFLLMALGALVNRKRHLGLPEWNAQHDCSSGGAVTNRASLLVRSLNLIGNRIAVTEKM